MAHCGRQIVSRMPHTARHIQDLCRFRCPIPCSNSPITMCGYPQSFRACTPRHWSLLNRLRHPIQPVETPTLLPAVAFMSPPVFSSSCRLRAMVLDCLIRLRLDSMR